MTVELAMENTTWELRMSLNLESHAKSGLRNHRTIIILHLSSSPNSKMLKTTVEMLVVKNRSLGVTQLTRTSAGSDVTFLCVQIRLRRSPHLI